MNETSCLFFAHFFHRWPGADWDLLPNEGSNQCALVTRAHSPCIMRIAGLEPDWDKCPRNPVIAEGGNA